jgi:hypothetical protein
MKNSAASANFPIVGCSNFFQFMLKFGRHGIKRDGFLFGDI